MKKFVSILLVGVLLVSCFPFANAQDVFPQEVPTVGDLQDDGKVTAVDALLVLRHVVGKWGNPQTMLQKADVNGDGKVTAQDALEMLKRSVGKPAVFSDSMLVKGVGQPLRVATTEADFYVKNHRKEYQYAFEQLASRKGIGTYVEPLTQENLSHLLETNAKAGTVDYDVVEVSPAVALTLAKQNAIANLNQSKTLNLSLFHPMATGYMTFGETLYGVATKATVNDPYLVLYNCGIAKEVASDWDIPTLVTEKQWTMERFVQFLEKGKVLSRVNGQQRIVRHGLTGNHTALYPLMAAQTGALGVRLEDKVTMVDGYNQMLPALSTVRGVYKKNNWRYWRDMGQALECFATGDAMCMVAPASKVSAIMEATNFQVGIAPLPLGENQTEYRSVHTNPRVFVVPKNKEFRLDVIGTWLNNTANLSGKIINSDLAAFTRLGADSQMVLTYKQLLENAQWDYAVNVDDFVSTFDEVFAGYIFSVKSFYGAVESYQFQLQKITEQFYAPLVDAPAN